MVAGNNKTLVTGQHHERNHWYAIISTMKREAYPAARTISPKVQAYFARHAAGARHRSQGRTTVPDAETIQAVIDAAFWASLRREEGYTPRISLACFHPKTPHIRSYSGDLSHFIQRP